MDSLISLNQFDKCRNSNFNSQLKCSIFDNNKCDSETFDSTDNRSEDLTWLDILGSGCLKKLVISKGNGKRASKGQLVTLDYEARLGGIDGEIVEVKEGIEVIVDDCDILKGIDLALSIMEEVEMSWIYFTSRFGYEDKGNGFNIPPGSDLYCLVNIRKVFLIPDYCNMVNHILLELAEQKKYRGNALFKLKLYNQASTVYLSAVRVLESQNFLQPESRDLGCRCLTNLALAQFHLNKKQDSLFTCNKALQLVPNDQKALYRKAKIYIDRQDYSEAIICLKYARDSNPFNSYIDVELGRVEQLLYQRERRNKEMYRRMFKNHVETSNNMEIKQGSMIKQDSIILTIIGAGVIGFVGLCIIIFIYKVK